jgi:HAE1 family hydrophobic/amphiphilic exporter-1
VTIEVTPSPEISLEAAINRLRNEIIAPLEEDGTIGPEYQVNLSGTADKLVQTWDSLRWNFLLALLITYLLMAALFESWLYPLVIIVSVPLGAVGGIIGLRLLGVYLHMIGGRPQSLDVLTMLGFVILVGTVVNNAILLVHQSLNLMRVDQMDSVSAILESIRTRIRPIFMTTLTTVFGLAPLVFFPGAGSELYRGIGSVILGGLVVSTVFTLVMIPALFSLVIDSKTALANTVTSADSPWPVAASPTVASATVASATVAMSREATPEER